MSRYRFGTVEVRPAERRVLVEGTPAALGGGHVAFLFAEGLPEQALVAW